MTAPGTTLAKDERPRHGHQRTGIGGVEGHDVESHQSEEAHAGGQHEGTGRAREVQPEARCQQWGSRQVASTLSSK